jgi:adenine-specific DNA-methyltransferase
MPHSKLRPSFTFDEEKLNELKKIAPEAFADGKINWDTLRESLGEYLEDYEESSESFGLFWPGKKQARRIASTPSKGTLIPVEGEGVEEENTHNIFIEGENLEVLKLLQKSYAGRIKMIYIDPPYNTGNDIVYEDDFKEPLQEYLKRTGQIDEEGKSLTTNTRADGRFHSKWLSMMYPRLRLARNLLRNDGVIFISIDDNEVHNLRELMNEIFGEENFIENIIWQKKYSPQNDATYFSTMHDYVICFAFKKKNNKKDVGWQRILLPRDEKSIERYKNFDNDPRGDWKPGDFTAEGPSKNCIYPIIGPTGIEHNPPVGKRWVFNYENYLELRKDNRLWFGNDGNNYPALKRFKSEVQDGLVPNSIWFYKDVGHTQEAKQEVNDLFDGIPVMDYPKPVRLLKRIVQISCFTNDIVLDFFAGSGTTSHAVIEINKEDIGNRKWIMVQMPENCDEKSEAFKAGYKTIAEISKERIRRVIKNLRNNKKGKLDFDKDKLDLGFKVFKLKESNFKDWNDYSGDSINELDTLFEKSSDPLNYGWKKKDLLNEILLLEGFPLDSKIKSLKEFKNNKIKQVTSDFHEHKLLICLDEKIEKETIKNMNLNENDIFVCLDSAITDKDKVNLSDKGFLKTI